MPRPAQFTLNGSLPIGPGINGYVTDQYSQGPMTVQCVPTGTVNFSVEVTHDDPFQEGGPVNWFDHVDPVTVNATAAFQTTMTNIPRAVRVVRNSGTGTVDCIIAQIRNA